MEKNTMDIIHLHPYHITDIKDLKINGENVTSISENTNKIIYVSKDGNDETGNGSFGNPFLTIQQGIDHTISQDGSINDATNQHLVMVYPGTYKEQIHSIDGIHIVGVHAPDNRYSKGVILVNDGTTESNYPLRSTIDDEYRIFGMNIETTNGNGILGKVLKTGIFGSCFFNGKWIESDLDTNHYMLFDDCDLRDRGWVSFKLEGTNLLGSRYISFHHSTMNDVAPVFYSTHVGTSNVSFVDNTVFVKAAFRLEGDWNLHAANSHIAAGREAMRGRSRIGGTGDINIAYCVLRSGLRFTNNPNSVFMGNNTFRDGHETIPSDEADIIADVDITNVEYSGNIQFNGISGCIQINNTEKHVGGNRNDMYFSLQHAIDSIPSSETATVRVWEDLTGLAELTLPNANTNIKIKGQKSYSLSFTGDIVEIGNDRILGFNDIVQLTGGNIELNGTSNELGFESCQYINAYVTLTNGAFAILYKSSLFGATGHSAITVDTVDPTIVIGYSRVQGSTGNPAITFNVDADDKFKAKYSTFIHGDKGANEPLINTVIGKVDVAVYNCGLNAAWDANKFYNTIGNANNTTDAQITF